MTTPTHYQAGSSDQRTLFQTESCLRSQKWSPYKVKGLFSILACTRKQNNGPSSADQAFSIASYNSHHALSARASAEPIFKMDCAK